MGNENSHGNDEAKFKREELVGNKNSIRDKRDCNKSEVNDYCERMSDIKGIASFKNSESLADLNNNSDSAINLDGKQNIINTDDDVLSFLHVYDQKRADGKKKFYDRRNFKIMENILEMNQADRNYIDAQVWKGEIIIIFYFF